MKTTFNTTLANKVQSKFILGIADKHEIPELQKLRYEDLVLEFDFSKSTNGLDVSEYDDFCDHLIVKDAQNNKIVGTYRLMTNEHLQYKDKFVCEDEFNITKLKNCNSNILELGRAVVHKDYRQGTVLKLLWNGIIQYAKEHGVRYLFGTASFHGTDLSLYENAFSNLHYNYLVSEQIACTPKAPSATLAPLKEHQIDMVKAKQEMPSLIKGYLLMGCKVCDGLFIDNDFNSIDTMIILDLENTNTAYFNKMFSI